MAGQSVGCLWYYARSGWPRAHGLSSNEAFHGQGEEMLVDFMNPSTDNSIRKFGSRQLENKLHFQNTTSRMTRNRRRVRRGLALNTNIVCITITGNFSRTIIMQLGDVVVAC